MHLQSLTITNWMAFKGKHSVELPAGPIAVSGVIDGSTRRSNWSGKTAALQAIRWCVYGKHRKRTEDELVYWGEASCEVSVILDDGVRITRTHAVGRSTELVYEDASGSKTNDAARDAIMSHLRFSAADMEATFWFAQDDLLSLVGTDPGPRRKILWQWFELEPWEKAAKLARDQLSTLTARLDALRVALPVFEEPTTDLEAERARVAEECKALEAVRAAGASASARLAALPRAGLDELDAQLERLASEGVAAKADLVDAGADLPSEDEVQAAVQEHDEVRNAFAAATRKHAEISRIHQEGFDGECPVMCAACPAADEVQRVVQGNAKALREATEEKSRWAGEQMRLSMRANGLRAQRQRHELARQRYEDLARRYRETRERRKQVEAAIAAVDVESLRADVKRGEDAASEIAERRMSLRMVESVHERAEVHRRTLDNHAARVRELETQVKVATLAVRALGSRGIPQLIAMERIEALEARGNALLGGLGLSFSVGWEQDTKELSAVCHECGHTYKGKRDKECPACGAARVFKKRDDVEILVEDGSGRPEDVSVKSGGAQMLVGSAIRLGAGMMLREIRGSAVAWAVVDEPFGFLDSENKEQLARTFASMLSSVGLEQALVVSHDYALLEAMPHRLVVEREGRASSLRMDD